MYWEEIDHYHERTMIPGGWLVKIFTETFRDGEYNIAMCFVPDKNHSWEIKKENEEDYYG